MDVETANSSRSSMCALGAVRVRDGRITDTFSSLVRPAEGHTFTPANVRVHGLTPGDVARAPEWPDVLPLFRDFVGSDLVVAHNARFDMSVVMNTCAEYDLDWPVMRVLCTLQAARSLLHLPSYALPWVSEYLGIESFPHHDALHDARAAARILIALVQAVGAPTLAHFASTLQIRPTSTDIDGIRPVTGSPSGGAGFAHQVVAFTGTLSSMTRAQARELVVDHGGQWQEGVSKTTTILVTGGLDPTLLRPGALVSEKLRKALDRVTAGQDLEIITEEDFLQRAALRAEELDALRPRGSRVPSYVVHQARSAWDGDALEWFREALRHPDGRARGGEACVWCGRGVPADTHWVHRDRHVCGLHCNHRLKVAARRAWASAGIAVPHLG